MLKKLINALDQWGYYLLALLCAAAIVLSAVWTNKSDEKTALDMSAAADQNERLSDVQFNDQAHSSDSVFRPCAGEILRGFTAEAIYFDALGMWRTHEALDFACGDTDEVLAMRAGRVIGAENGDVTIDHGDGSISVYRGVLETVAEMNASVAAGDVIARGGTPLHGGESGVCVSVRREGTAIDFFDWFGINRD